MAKSKSENNIQEKDTNTKPKKTKKVETEKVDDVKVVDDVKIDVEIDLRNVSKQPCVYIRRKRSI